MTDTTMLLDITDKIGTITINKPERKNAIDASMVNQWVEILDECRDNDNISAIILTGAGEAFVQEEIRLILVQITKLTLSKQRIISGTTFKE